MTRIATMGTSSCATIAIAGFKDEQKKLNESYRKDPNSFKLEGLSVDEFYDKVLYPVSQPLGSTGEYPFDLLIEKLNRSAMRGKFIIATLNSYQFFNGYFTRLLLENGFSLVDKTKNSIGEMNYVFIRNGSKRDITDKDTKFLEKLNLTPSVKNYEVEEEEGEFDDEYPEDFS